MRARRAERALLTILKIDNNNAPAYNKLGILYAKQGEYKDAVECFKLANEIEATPASWHNLGLVYYEQGEYEDAALAFSTALKMEDTLAPRHVAYAKVQEKLGNESLMFQALEKAADLEPSKEVYTLLQQAYLERGMHDKAATIERKLADQRDLPLDAVVSNMKQLVEATKKHNQDLDRIAAKYGL